LILVEEEVMGEKADNGFVHDFRLSETDGFPGKP
jgi:hypothetical protein